VKGHGGSSGDGVGGDSGGVGRGGDAYAGCVYSAQYMRAGAARWAAQLEEA
jgi:hypothetical protein